MPEQVWTISMMTAKPFSEAKKRASINDHCQKKELATHGKMCRFNTQQNKPKVSSYTTTTRKPIDSSESTVVVVLFNGHQAEGPFLWPFNFFIVPNILCACEHFWISSLIPCSQPSTCFTVFLCEQGSKLYPRPTFNFKKDSSSSLKQIFSTFDHSKKRVFQQPIWLLTYHPVQVHREIVQWKVRIFCKIPILLSWPSTIEIFLNYKTSFADAALSILSIITSWKPALTNVGDNNYMLVCHLSTPLFWIIYQPLVCLTSDESLTTNVCDHVCDCWCPNGSSTGLINIILLKGVRNGWLSLILWSIYIYIWLTRGCDSLGLAWWGCVEQLDWW